MATSTFFDETTEQSLVKATIVSKYFWAWANVIISSEKKYKHNLKIAYIDLFAGPGRYKDGTKSTPLLILEKAIADENMRKSLVTIFNDKDIDNVQSLEKAINSLPGIETLAYKPQIANKEIGDEIVKMFEKMKLVPTLFFVDPWGYKGLSLRLINSVLRNWGCDCIIFFNYTRINMGLNNPKVIEHMSALFGKEHVEELSVKLGQLSPEEREAAIIEKIVQALQNMGGKFVLPFCFKNNRGTRTNHHLIFVSKDFKGYDIMKGIMASESTRVDQGVPGFEYCPATERQLLLFELNRPLNQLDQLKDMLLKEYAGKTISMGDIYEQHSVGKPYIAKNYKDVLTELENEDKIKTNPPAKKRLRRKGKITFGDNVTVTFS